MFTPIDERIYWLFKGKDFYFNDPAKKYSTIWNIFTRNTVKGDSLPFPDKLPFRCITACSREGDIVCDPYLGTGTTMMVCETTKRRCFGIEIDLARCEKIVARWERATGLNAVAAEV